MPIFDYYCEKCGTEYIDKYVSSGEADQPIFCTFRKRPRVMKKKGRSVIRKVKQCGRVLLRLIGAPAPPVMKVGKAAGEATRREAAIETKKKMLKRSYNHEFKKDSPGVEERRARIDQLKK